MSLAKFILNNVYCQLYWKDENKEKEAGNCPFYVMYLSPPTTYTTLRFVRMGACWAVAFKFSVDRSGDFWMILGTNFLSNVAQKFGFFLAILKNIPSSVKTALPTFWVSFEKFWATFYSNHGSYCIWFTLQEVWIFLNFGVGPWPICSRLSLNWASFDCQLRVAMAWPELQNSKV